LRLAELPCKRRRVEDQVEFGYTCLRQRDGGLDGLDGSENRRKRVENCEELIHARIVRDGLAKLGM